VVVSQDGSNSPKFLPYFVIGPFQDVSQFPLELEDMAGFDTSFLGARGAWHYKPLSPDITIPGNSGSPIIDAEGNIIGLVTAAHSFVQAWDIPVPTTTAWARSSWASIYGSFLVANQAGNRLQEAMDAADMREIEPTRATAATPLLHAIPTQGTNKFPHPSQDLSTIDTEKVAAMGTAYVMKGTKGWICLATSNRRSNRA